MGDKGKGLLSYLLGWLGGLIVLAGMKNNTKRDVMNAAQGIIISVGNIIVSVAAGFLGRYVPFFPGIISILFFALIIIGVVNVLSDKDPKLPVIGDIAESLFAKQLADAPEFINPNGGVNFDPNTGEPINKQPEANFDPNTGEPINKQPEANFDPNTGELLNKQPEANFDPNTGEPINKQPEANFDPNTGESINKQPEANFDPNTGETINKQTEELVE